MNAVDIVRELLAALIASRKDGKLFESQLKSREIDRRLQFIGPEVFDPHGIVRASIRARDLLEFADECDSDPKPEAAA